MQRESFKGDLKGPFFTSRAGVKRNKLPEEVLKEDTITAFKMQLNRYLDRRREI